jgi:hypothetical protein
MRRWLLIASACLVAGGAAVHLGATVSGEVREKAARAKAADNLSSVIKFLLASGERPEFHGKRSLLSLVASGRIDARHEGNLEVLFSPRDSTRSVAKAGGAEAFRRMTIETLRDPSFDPRPFTSYAGPRSVPDGERAAIESRHGTPLLADLSFGDGALVAFTDGRVAFLTREDLGLSAGSRIAVGPSSASLLLRSLSDE